MRLKYVWERITSKLTRIVLAFIPEVKLSQCVQQLLQDARVFNECQEITET